MSVINPLTALSPLDGRYNHQVSELRHAFSEFGLIHSRVKVEIAWLIALCDAPDLPALRSLTPTERQQLEALADHFTPADAQRVKEIESTTNHDVKAVEYYIKERLANTSLADLSEFVHFACTSEDINNLSHALMLRKGLTVLRTAQNSMTQRLTELAFEWRDIPMLARTHGQTASPTTLGKELAVFVSRLQAQASQLDAIVQPAKLNGAVGNYSAHLAAAPDTNWEALARSVIEGHFGLRLNPLTTQIEPHDTMAELFDTMARWNSILLDLNRDLWSYISLGYLSQKTIAGEVGSSTMPHKVNPIDFENSEGNLGIANAILQHMARKLQVSRLQRDLSDSTVLRNMGTGFGYTLIACRSTLRGLNKITPNHQRLAADLDNAWEVLAEPIQTLMRRLGLPNPYEQLKELTRGQQITPELIHKFINSLDIPSHERQQLLSLTPATYTGAASQLVNHLNTP